jgi:gamma-glutamylcyclotransferase (GGCT)/AIG2-like uncharacterized protein YtfP
MYVFVYGTLKEGYGNNYLLGREEFIGKAEALEPFSMFNSGFPVLTQAEPEMYGVVKGEIYRILAESTLKNLDALEGNGSMYSREVRIFQLEDGTNISAWVYIGVTDYWERAFNNKDRFYQPNEDGILNWPDGED